MKFRKRLLLLLLLPLVWSCTTAEEDAISIKSNTFDFNNGELGWRYGFAEYPSDQDSASFELKYAYTDKPASLPEGKSLMLFGKNPSPELFMYIKKQVVDLRPETDYTITFNVELASSAIPSSATAVAPGVYLKVGAVSYEPQTVKTPDKVVVNVDKGTAEQDGVDMINIGNVIGGNSADYTLTLRSSAAKSPTPIQARTDADGTLWLIVGTESNFPGSTTVFYSKINVVFTVTSR